MKKNITKLFKNLCCSVCKEGFNEDSLIIKRDEAGLFVVNLQCQNCGKKYGIAFLGFSDINIKNEEPFEVIEGPDPISYDDVIDAHRFIKNLDENWNKYLPK